MNFLKLIPASFTKHVPSLFKCPPLLEEDMLVWPLYNQPKIKRSKRLFPPPDEDILKWAHPDIAAIYNEARATYQNLRRDHLKRKRLDLVDENEDELRDPDLAGSMEKTEARSPTVGFKDRVLMRPRSSEPDPPRQRLTTGKIAIESGITDPSTLTPREKRLARTAIQYHTIARRIKRLLQFSQRQSATFKKLAKKTTVDMIDEMLISPEAKIILESQLENWKKKPNGRRWTIKMKCLALAIWKRSRRVYRWLSTIIALPVESTLRDLLIDIPLEPGINLVAIDNLSKKTAEFSSTDRICQVMFDEVSLKKGLYWNKKSKLIEGFEDYGLNGRTVGLATHALVFMVQGINRKFKQPVAFYFSPLILKDLLVNVVQALQNIGLHVIASVSDQGSTNRGAINELRKTCEEVSYESIGWEKICHIYDIPHIFKNIRNNLMKCDIDIGLKQKVSWEHLIQYKQLCENILFKKISLTNDHLFPTGKKKMRCKLAMETLSHTVASDIAVINVASEGRYLSNCLVTAKFICDVDLFLDLSQGGGPKDKQKPLQRCLVTRDSVHHVMWSRMLGEMNRWKFIRKFGKKKGEVHVPICLKGWIDNIKCFQRIWKNLHDNFNIRDLNLRTLNQDPIENFFSIIRSTNSSNRNPTVQQFIASMKTAIVNKLSSSFIKGKNCADDPAALLSDMLEVIGQSRSVNSSCETTTPTAQLFGGELDPKIFRTDHYRSKCNRQDPALWCTKIANKILSNDTFSACLSCRSSLLIPSSEATSADHLLQGWLQLTALQRHLADLQKNHKTELSSYSDLLKLKMSSEETRRSSYASPSMVNTYLLCHRNFLLHCQSFLFLSDVHDPTLQICSASSFEWLCSEHHQELKTLLVNSLADSFLEGICKKINKVTRDAEKLKSVKSALHSKWRSRVFNHVDKRNRIEDEEEWEDVESLLRYVDGIPEPATPVSSPSSTSGHSFQNGILDEGREPAVAFILNYQTSCDIGLSVINIDFFSWDASMVTSPGPQLLRTPLHLTGPPISTPISITQPPPHSQAGSTPLCVTKFPPLSRTPLPGGNQSVNKSKQVPVLSSMTPPQPVHPVAPKYLFPPESIHLGWRKLYPVGAGMRNQGNTCYLNAALQALFHVPAFVSWLLEDREKHGTDCLEKKNNLCLACSLAETLHKSHSIPMVVPARIYNQLPMIDNYLKRGRQEDSREFKCKLLAKLGEEFCKRFKSSISSNSYTTPIHLIFGGYLIQEVTCLKCRGKATRSQYFSDLVVDMGASVEESVLNYFKPTSIKGYACGRCQKPQEGSSGRKYKLVALVEHHGPRSNCGHYSTIAVAANGSVFRFDDEKVSAVTESCLLEAQPYYLFYERTNESGIERKSSSRSSTVLFNL
ncbi:LOW QUALITY PROTEIN: Ubiquitin carboxyl-terminal hydrolase 36 [Frankliniella fusca]|uniref:Ubiquitin carboxyl-terminal hydrolase 36 n=1 Tax=Frankliniella fusca TaxID=407009 RepID=A0AAE1HDG7_9NEOP|nr:LOW QUALITY PROTEIN: Ubiquitin carboxyl-terminal hydrolase 36 [Frankliniella fusca]